MKFRNIKILILFVCIGFGCQNSVNKQLNKLNIFEGTWKMQNEPIYENWNKNRHFWSGNVMKVEEKDTSILENLSIEILHETIFYRATVINQNNNKPVYFQLIKQEKNHFHFQNLKHDFPQNIIYNFLNDSVLAITISDSIQSKKIMCKKIKS